MTTAVATTPNFQPKTCSECPFARHIEGNKYGCSAQVGMGSVRGHWEPASDCKDELAKAEAEQAQSAATQPQPAPQPWMVPAQLINAVAFDGQHAYGRYIKLIFEDEQGKQYTDVYNSEEYSIQWLRSNLKIGEWCWISPNTRVTWNPNRKGHEVFVYHLPIAIAA